MMIPKNLLMIGTGALYRSAVTSELPPNGPPLQPRFDALGFGRSKPAATGRPGYAPRDLLALYIYGYLYKLRSSRVLERECERNG